MGKRIICLFLLGMFCISGCGQTENVEMPKVPDIPEMEELVEQLEPEEFKEEPVLPDGDAWAYVTRGTYFLQEFDITGDGEKDSVEVVCYGESDTDEGYAKGWDIIINGVLAYDLYSAKYIQPEISFYILNEKCVYIAIKEYAPGNSDLNGFQLYQYKNENIKPVCDFYEEISGTTYEEDFYADIVSAQAGTITLYCRSQFETIGYPEWYMTYIYDGEWRLDSDVPIISEGM